MFKVHVVASRSSLGDIAQCRLSIVNSSSGVTVAEYILPAETNSVSGLAAYGCLLGQTRAEIGYLSYSSCCGEKETLTFYLEATSSAGGVVQVGSSTGTCAHYLPDLNEVVVNLEAKPIN